VVVTAVGAVLPHLGAIELLAVVPFAVVGLRNRVRAVTASIVAATFVAFLVGGVTSAAIVAGCALLGGLCGTIRRRSTGAGTFALDAAVWGAKTVSCALTCSVWIT
jgi:energy-coupling factor transport system ATP-binding protein